eukprot:5501761-Prymnesium_polylepis.1
MEAVPAMWPQEQPVQGQGVFGGTQATADRFQSGRGRRGGGAGRGVGLVLFRGRCAPSARDCARYCDA